MSLTKVTNNMVENPDDFEITSTGSSMARKLSDRFSSTVDVKDFGAVGDGIVDDTQAFADAFSYAEGNGKKVVASGVFSLVSGVISTTALFDFSEATINVSSGTGTVLSLETSHPWEDVTGEVLVSELIKGETHIPSLASHKGKFLKIESNDLSVVRHWSGGTANIYQSEVTTLVDTDLSGQEGWLENPLVYTYTDLDTVQVKGIDSPATVYLPKFRLFNTSSVNLFGCSRSHTKIVGGDYKEGSSSGSQVLGNGISVSNATNVEIDGFSSEKATDLGTSFSYTVIFTYSQNLIVRNVKSLGNWATVDGNYFKNLLVEDCQGSRFGGHFSCWDLKFNRVISEQGFTAEGGGLLQLTGCKLPNQAILLSGRSDYGCRWQGDIVIRDSHLGGGSYVTWNFGHRFVSFTLTDPNDGTVDYQSQDPLGITGSVLIDGVVIDPTLDLSNTYWTMVRVGNNNANSLSMNFSFPKTLTVRNVDFGKITPVISYRGEKDEPEHSRSVIFEKCRFNKEATTSVNYVYWSWTDTDYDNSKFIKVTYRDCDELKFRSTYHLQSILVERCSCYGMDGEADITHPYPVHFIDSSINEGSYTSLYQGTSFTRCTLYPMAEIVSSTTVPMFYQGNYVSSSDTIIPRDTSLSPSGYSGGYLSRDIWQGNGRRGVVVKIQSGVRLAEGGHYASANGFIYKIQIDPTSATTESPVKWTAGSSRGFGQACYHKGNIFVSYSSGTNTTEEPCEVGRDFSTSSDKWIYMGEDTGYVVATTAVMVSDLSSAQEGESVTSEGVRFVYLSSINT